MATRLTGLVSFLSCIVSVGMLTMSAGAATVKVGEDQTFVSMDWHRAGFTNDPNNFLTWPELREATSVSNTASVFLEAMPGQAGVARAGIGLSLDWDIGTNSWDDVKDLQVRVTMDMSYELMSEWLDANGGSANAFLWAPAYEDGLGYETGETGSRSRTVTSVFTNTLEELEGRIAVQAYCQAHLAPDAPLGASHTSHSSVTLNSITLEFIERVSWPYRYTVDNGTVTITRYLGADGAVIVPDRIAGLPVAGIGDFAFLDCDQLAGVTIPARVKHIGGDAFYGCDSLASVALPASVTSIGVGAFGNCGKLTTITVAAQNAVYSSLAGVLFNKGQTMIVQYPAGKAGSYSIPNAVTNIGSAAFIGCRFLTGVAIPDAAVNIGIKAFFRCDRLTSVIIPDRVRLIDITAFDGCSRLVSMLVGSGVTDIGSGAFSECNALTGLYFKGNAPSLGEWVFDNSSVAVIYHVAVATGWGETFGGRPTALWNGVYRQMPVISARSPVADPAAVNEGVSIAFNITAGDGTDPDAALRGMSNIMWLVDGTLRQTTKTGAPNSITSAFTFKTDSATVQGVAFRDVQVKAVALDKQGETTETEWTVRVNNVPAAQTITFKTLPVVVLGGTNFNPGASSSSGLAVAYSSTNPEVAKIVDGLIRIIGAGTAVITASQPGTADFKAAAPVRQTLTIKARLTTEVFSGGGTVTGAGLYLPGVKIPLTAKAAAGNTLLRWEDGSQDAVRNFMMPNANTTVLAWFGITTNVPPPVITEPGAQRAMVGVRFLLPLDIRSDSLPSVAVTGLPAGLKYDAAAKSISGVPTAAVTNRLVTVKAVNVSKTPVTLTFSMTVDSLPAWAQGTFNGAAGTDELGSGLASMSVTPVGGATGKLTLRGTNFSFNAASYAFRDMTGAFWLTVTAKVSQVTLPLTLSVYPPEIIDTTGRVPATLGKVSAEFSGGGWATLYRNVWKDTGMMAVATNYSGYYTAVLPGGAEFGSGYLLLTVDKAGGIKTVGKLADGTAVSQSGPLIIDEKGTLFSVLYAAPTVYKGGGVFGGVEFIKSAAGAAQLRLMLEDAEDDDKIEWESFNPQATPVYGEGFRCGLGVLGGWYDTVGNLYRYYADRTLTVGTDGDANELGLIVGTNHNASAWWRPDGVGLAVVTNRLGEMTGLAAPKAGVPADSDNDHVWDYSATNTVGLTVALTRATGVFKGSFKAWFDYAATHSSKTVAFEGVLTPEREDTADGVAGRGFFLWADTSTYLSPQQKLIPYSFNWSYDLKILN